MRRREFISLLGGAVAASPLTAHAQQSGQMRRIGVLIAHAESDPEFHAYLAAFREGTPEARVDGRPQHSNRLSLGGAR